MYKRASVKSTSPAPSSLPHGQPQVPISVYSLRDILHVYKLQANNIPSFMHRIVSAVSLYSFLFVKI